MNILSDERLIEIAKEAAKKAYCKYSGFAVGAALLCSDGTVYTGCNIENASFTPTVCAERVAFFKAVSDGRHEFSAIAIVGYNSSSADTRSFAPPCGVCRQVMSEFCGSDFRIIMSESKNGNEKLICKTLAEMLPFGFSGDQFI